MARLALYVLGPVRLERDGVPVAADTRKAIALLVYLVLTGEAHSRDTLAGLFWPDYDQSHARATLRRTLSALKDAVTAEALEIAHDTIGLASNAGLTCDAVLFRALIASCATHGHAANEVCARCIAPLEQAVALYRGDLLAGFVLRDSPAFDDWQFFQQESLRRELAGALERLARAHAGQRDWDAAIAAARRRLALDRLHEPAHRLLMQLYARAGQRAAALRQYRECVQVLDRELGVAPLEATTRLYEAIREHKAEPRPAAPPATEAATSSASATSAAETETRQSASVPSAAAPTVLPFVGRAAELLRLRAAYDAANRRGQVIALEGEAGIGKTRLAEELLAQTRARGAVALTARCYEGEAGLAYAPIAALLRPAFAAASAQRRLAAIPDLWLAEAVRLSPELALRRPGLAPAPPLETPGAQTHFFEGLVRVLAAACEPLESASSGGNGADGAPGILFFDDLQWADSASLDVLTYLARRISAHRICLLFTRRDDDTPGQARLDALIAEAQRAGNATILSLARLAPQTIRELVAARAPGAAAPTDQTIERLYAESEGLPLFLVEYLTALGQGELGADAAAWALPGGVRALLRSRLGAVSETGWQILTTAAVIGRSFDFEALREVSGRGEEEAVSALEELAARGLVREADETRDASRVLNERALLYDFTHDKLRALVYEETSLARRRLLHRRVAEALAARARGAQAEGDLSGQIAAHYLKAGSDTQAATYYQLAGERARALYANREALAQFQNALALGHPDAAGLHLRIGDLHTLLGDYPAAIASYETAAALSPPAMLPTIEHKLGGVFARRGEWERAQSHLEAALDALDGLDAERATDTPESATATAERARICADASLVAQQRQQPAAAQRLAQEALRLAESAADRQAQAQAHNTLGMLASGAGQVDTAIEQLARSLALAEDRDDPAARAAALNNLALAYTARGDTTRARACAEDALALAAAQGDRHREAALHNNLADILHRAGQPDDAMIHLKQAVAIFADIGVEAGTVQPEIWKLTEW